MASKVSERLGARLRELRVCGPTRWTQRALAQRAGISVAFLSMIERGSRLPHLETLAGLAEALETSLPDLFRDPAHSGKDEAKALRMLSDFVRSHKLSAQDVDLLLRVAQAMF